MQPYDRVTLQEGGLVYARCAWLNVLWKAEEVEGAAHRPQVLATHLEIAGCGSQGAMPQEDLDGVGIDARVDTL
jgi:hypothetical protein